MEQQRDAAELALLKAEQAPVEGTVVYPIIYKVLASSNRWLGMGFPEPSTGFTTKLFFCGIHVDFPDL